MRLPVVLLFLLALPGYALSAPKEYRRILEAYPLHLDPAVMEDSNSLQVLLQTAEGLLSIERSSIVPAVAKRWEVSQDQTVYTFFLSPDAKFSDGRQIRADDVIQSLLYVLQHGPNWRDIALIRGAEKFRNGKTTTVAGLTKLTDSIVRISIEKPFPPFLEILATPAYSILPAASLEMLHRKNVAPFISSGPYSVSEVTPKTIRLVKNRFYSRANEVYYDSILYTVETDRAAAAKGFIDGKYDDIWPYRVSDLPPKLASTVEELPALAAFTWYLELNLHRKAVHSLALRRFIANNVDIDGFLKASGYPAHFRATGMIPRGLLGFRSTPYRWPEVDPQVALSGCTPAAPCKIEFIYSYDLQDALNALFVPLRKYSDRLKITLTKLDRDVWYRRFQKGEYAGIFIANNASYFDTYMLLRYLLDEPYFPGIDRKAIGPLLDKALHTTAKGARAEIYQSIEELLLEQASVIPIFHGEHPTLQVRKEIRGYQLSVLGFPYLKLMFLRGSK